MALAGELGLAPMQLHALHLIEPGVEVPMSSLAGKLFCDASNVSGIVDRLEHRRALRDALRAAMASREDGAAALAEAPAAQA
jgi:DNA-binding MarR family transcriptional regulator